MIIPYIINPRYDRSTMWIINSVGLTVHRGRVEVINIIHILHVRLSAVCQFTAFYSKQYQQDEKCHGDHCPLRVMGAVICRTKQFKVCLELNLNEKIILFSIIWTNEIFCQFFSKTKTKTPKNIIYVQRGPIQSGLSMYAFSVKNFYLLSCEDINTRSAYTSIDD